MVFLATKYSRYKRDGWIKQAARRNRRGYLPENPNQKPTQLPDSFCRRRRCSTASPVHAERTNDSFSISLCYSFPTLSRSPSVILFQQKIGWNFGGNKEKRRLKQQISLPSELEERFGVAGMLCSRRKNGVKMVTGNFFKQRSPGVSTTTGGWKDGRGQHTEGPEGRR